MFKKNILDNKSREHLRDQHINKLNSLFKGLRQKEITFEVFVQEYLNEPSAEISEQFLHVSEFSDKERAEMMAHLTKLRYKPVLIKQDNDFALPYYRIDFTAQGRNTNYDNFSDLPVQSSCRPQ